MKYFKKYEEYYVDSYPWKGGCAFRFTFNNAYTVRVMRHEDSIGGANGLWEIAIIYNDELVCDTPLTNVGIIGNLTTEKVEEILGKVKSLPMR